MNTMSDNDKQDEVRRIAEALARPFGPEAIRFRCGATNGNRAMALAYVDSRAVQDRLDEVLGVAGWQDSYEVLADGSVKCSLALCIAGQFVLKQDVGSPSA